MMCTDTTIDNNSVLIIRTAVLSIIFPLIMYSEYLTEFGLLVKYLPYSLKFSRTKNFVVCQISLEKVIFVIKFSWISCSVLRIIFKISVRAPRE